jgi:hypothetical protein
LSIKLKQYHSRGLGHFDGSYVAVTGKRGVFRAAIHDGTNGNLIGNRKSYRDHQSPRTLIVSQAVADMKKVVTSIEMDLPPPISNDEINKVEVWDLGHWAHY